MSLRSIPREPEAYRKDVPNAEVHILDGGHFALDTAADEIAGFVGEFHERVRQKSSVRTAHEELIVGYGPNPIAINPANLIEGVWLLWGLLAAA